jgi:hypothetical protein
VLLREVGDVVTPVDDPCQFDPAWRSIVATFLFSEGLCGGSDMEQLAKTGCVAMLKDEGKAAAKSKKKVKGKDKGKKPDVKTATTIMRPLEPFASNERYRCLVMDKWISDYLQMCTDEASGMPLRDEHVAMKLARRWHLEPDCEWVMRKRLEPLLLTEATMDVVAMDLVGVASARPAIEAYERLYFNCRGDDWNLHPSMQLTQRFATPYGPLRTYLKKGEIVDDEGFIVGDGRPLARECDVWKAVAATMGYEALIYVWRWWGRAHGMKDDSLEHMLELSWKVSVSKMFIDLFNGDIRHEDVARVLSAYTAQSKRISERRAEGKAADGGDSTVQALMAVLYQTSPHMVSVDSEEESRRNEEIQSRIKSQMAISSQQIDDNGIEVDAEVIDMQIDGAING